MPAVHALLFLAAVIGADPDTRPATAKYLDAIRQLDRDDWYGASQVIQSIHQSGRKEKTDAVRMAEDVTEARFQLAFGKPKDAIRTIQKRVDEIPNFLKEHPEAIREDPAVWPLMNRAYTVLITAYLRQGDTARAAQVTNRLLGLTAPAAREGLRKWFYDQQAREKVQSILLPGFQSLIESLTVAIAQGDAGAIQGFFSPASSLYAQIPGLLEKYDYKIIECRILEIQSDTATRQGTPALLKVYIEKVIEPKDDPTMSSDEGDPSIMPHQMIHPTGTPDASASNGLEKIHMRFDGQNWKIEQFDFHVVPFYHSPDYTGGFVIR